MENIINRESKILYLTLKKQWFDLINSGNKTEEYREIKPYWTKRLEDLKYDFVEFRHGYSSDAPKMLFAIKDITISTGKIEWGAEKDVKYYVIKLGERIE